jgi:hypothetical protein
VCGNDPRACLRRNPKEVSDCLLFVVSLVNREVKQSEVISLAKIWCSEVFSLQVFHKVTNLTSRRCETDIDTALYNLSRAEAHFMIEKTEKHLVVSLAS